MTKHSTAGELVYRTRLCYYIASAAIVLISFLLWYNFSSPPINSNIDFNLYPWRQVGLFASPFNPYFWPGSFTPPILGSPAQAYYGLFYTFSGASYGLGLFLSVVVLDVIGGLCLFYLLTVWLTKLRISPSYGLIGILIYAFNDYKLLSGFGTTDGYFSAGVIPPGDPATLIILVMLSYLALFRARRFALLLGAFSILAFSSFPVGTLVMAEEYLVAFAILLCVRWHQSKAEPTLPRVITVLKESGLVLGVIVLSNLYLVFPFILVSGQYSGALSSGSTSYAFSYAFDSVQTFGNTIRLVTNWAVFTPRAPTWANTYLTSPPSVLLSYLVPFLALGSVLFVRRLAIYFVYALTLCILLFSTSINSPLGPTFAWLTSNVSALRAFYEGETFTGPLLVLYCLLAPVTVAGLTKLSRNVPSRVAEIPSKRSRGSSFQLRIGVHFHNHSRRWLVLPVLLATMILLSAYPALTPQFSASSSPSYPVSSTLPPYYSAASNFLSSVDPNAPTMIFPQVAEFDSNVVNGSTWYAGLNPYPDLISNPSISSIVPSNYVGATSSSLSIPGFVYATGGQTCTTPACVAGGVSPVPSPYLLSRNQSVDYITANTSIVSWRVALNSDSVAIGLWNNSERMQFTVNSSIAESNGHWLLGFLPHPENFSAYAYAIISYTLAGTSSRQVQFGFHSFSNYTAGNAYYLGNFLGINGPNAETALIPLSAPSIRAGGDLTNVTNFYFVDDSPFRVGRVVLTIDSLRLVKRLPYLASSWAAGNPEDRVSLTQGNQNTTVHFAVNQSVYEGNGHWLLASFTSPVNLSKFNYVILKYTLNNARLSYLQTGYHSFSASSRGDGFPLTNYITIDTSGQYTSLIPLSAPSTLDNGSLYNVTNFYLVYSPPTSQPGWAFINVTSIAFTMADPTGARGLAIELTRLGVEFAYVDTSIGQTNYVGFLGNYYNQVFGRSRYFETVFHSGTVTIYRDLLYSGLVTPLGLLESIPSVDVEVEGVSFPFFPVYYNTTNLNVGYVDSGANLTQTNWTKPLVSDVVAKSPTQVSFDVSALNESVVELNMQYSPLWQARLSSGASPLLHFEINGYANAWILPPGSYRVVLTIGIAQLYGFTESGLLVIPAALLGGFLIMGTRSASSLCRRKAKAK